MNIDHVTSTVSLTKSARLTALWRAALCACLVLSTVFAGSVALARAPGGASGGAPPGVTLQVTKGVDVAPETVPARAADHVNPEAATGVGHRELAHAEHYMVSAANPFASRAGADILAQGGSAADAAIAAQLVLNLVEPQSSGIGGGGFIVSYDAASGAVQAWDGRETAPALATQERFMRDGKPLPFWDAVNNGMSVGTPGLLRVLSLLHEQHGRLPWGQLFQPAIGLAEHGFPVSDRLHKLLAANDVLRQQPAAAAYFYDAAGRPWPVGHILKNPAMARVLRAVALQGPDAFYTGQTAQRIVDAVASHVVPGDLSLDDLAGYQALEREPLCMPYKTYELCGMPPPSAGPLTVMQILAILSHTPIAELEPDSLMSVHYFAEAGRLAYADRDVYVADPDFVEVPGDALLDPGYLAERAALIRPDRSMGIARPGTPVEASVEYGHGSTPELTSTTHIATADRWGNVISMTSSIESAFGSKIFVDGFLLNNELTDFSLTGVDEDGRPVANRIEPLKRPRSSMAPMLVLKDGQPVMAIGSPGGSAIINYVAKAVLGVLDWNMNIQQAIDLANRGSRNRYTELEKGTALTRLSQPLRDMGHDVREVDFPSGLQGLVFTPRGIEGGADPRREGLAIGR